MVLVARVARGLMPLAILAIATEAHDDRIDYQSSEVSDTPSTATFCEARTINYITHTLPQLCLTDTWRNAFNNHDATASASPTTVVTWLDHETDSSRSTAPPDVRASATDAETPDTDTTFETTPSEALASPFMSFEDWKEMMLRRTGQDPQDLRSRRATNGQGFERIPPDMGHFGLGEEDEISLDFNNYLEKPGHDQSMPSSSDDGPSEGQQNDAEVYEGDKASLHRSKDAGKTCKERFSYSSFDAGATILKTGRGTKNAKAILVENKDSYMLLECAINSKYVIVELSDDILIDTIVLANFEFFSSMIRQFQVSVSDRYPVKMDRWKDIGTFEARNSRDIQAFLVENPQIWAKYVRIEFLSHYGNEYYCPVSLLRIHGSRMLDSWKDNDPGREEEISIDDDDAVGVIDGANAAAEDANSSLFGDAGEPAALSLNFTPWNNSPWDSLNLLVGTCHLGTSVVEEVVHTEPNTSKQQVQGHESTSDTRGAEDDPAQTIPKHQGSNQNESPSPSTTTASSFSATHDGRATPKLNSTSTSATMASEASGDHSTSTIKSATPASPTGKLRSTGTSSAPTTSPTVQEGFFNAITKRLHHVESNLTLSLQYLEDHSRYMQEALQKAEQKQLSKVTIFLENLNQTVLAELRGMRDQYEQIWQSTVIALESQKEQSDRDVVALSSRLNLLADEVVFQKRMAIVQAVLLLCCLFLVIFSRGVPIPYLAPLLDHNGPATGYPASQHPHSHPTVLFPPSGRRVPSDDPMVSHHRNDHSSVPSPDGTNGTDPAIKHGLPHHGEVVSAGSNEADESLNHSHPSPPLTPGLQADAALADSSAQAFELQSPSSRRLQSYQSRKALPALPEHPSPDRSPSL